MRWSGYVRQVSCVLGVLKKITHYLISWQKFKLLPDSCPYSFSQCRWLSQGGFFFPLCQTSTATFRLVSRQRIYPCSPLSNWFVVLIFLCLWSFVFLHYEMSFELGRKSNFNKAHSATVNCPCGNIKLLWGCSRPKRRVIVNIKSNNELHTTVMIVFC